MCGIIGYIGRKNIVDVLIAGLKQLEYRGYDSSGIAIVKDGKIFRHRVAGKVLQLESSLPKNFNTYPTLSANICCGGIAHTRWATHGKPSEENAHPHTDCRERFVIVHNGIIENFFEIKNKLTKHTFSSETDTEVIVHLIEENYKTSVIEAIKKSIKLLDGSYAFLLMSTYEPDKVFFARKDSPLIIGVGEKENFVASDITAMLEYTNKFIFLENGDYGEISSEEIKIFNITHENIQQRSISVVNWTPQMVQKA
ncbi:MAG: class II glutamine amidotransferase, partial [Endomicrobia bacterium]|nr:class II glutamine amidotransferase [Endomicrobiia bacterium]